MSGTIRSANLCGALRKDSEQWRFQLVFGGSKRFTEHDDVHFSFRIYQTVDLGSETPVFLLHRTRLMPAAGASSIEDRQWQLCGLCKLFKIAYLSQPRYSINQNYSLCLFRSANMKRAHTSAVSSNWSCIKCFFAIAGAYRSLYAWVTLNA